MLRANWVNSFGYETLGVYTIQPDIKHPARLLSVFLHAFVQVKLSANSTRVIRHKQHFDQLNGWGKEYVQDVCIVSTVNLFIISHQSLESQPTSNPSA